MVRKKTVWTFQVINKPNFTWENLDMAKKGNLKRETESLLMPAQNNAIRTNNVKARIGRTQQIANVDLCGNRENDQSHDKRMQQISEKRDLKITWNARHNSVGKVIPWELCKKFKFDPTNKWYMHNRESFLENEPHKLLWYFETQTDRLISVRRPDLMIVNKKREPAD